MHDAYDWFKDIGLPALVGVGSIAVGLVAALVAQQSHNLAVQVRRDEAKRDEAAARERYRDHLFSTVELAVSALLEFRSHLASAIFAGVTASNSPIANVKSRLNMIAAIANEDDRKVVQAVLVAFEGAVSKNGRGTLHNACGDLARALPRLLADGRDADTLVAHIREVEANFDVPNGS